MSGYDGPKIAAEPEFGSGIAEFYQKHLVPLIFEPYAADIARRLAGRTGAELLETAAGTGVVTRALATALPASVAVTATDVSKPMLDLGRKIGAGRPIRWLEADATDLPFADDSFDILVSQFGFMFFADRAKAFAEAHRVLRPGGTLLFSVWDRIEENQFVDTVVRAVSALFPGNPPTFIERVPHGYYQSDQVGADMAAGGFTAAPELETVSSRSKGSSARAVAVAYCEGTPLHNEIEKRDPQGIERAIDAAEEALKTRFGSGPIDGQIRARVVTTRA